MNKAKIVILGAGFAGLNMARKLAKTKQFDIVLIDRFNYHQFQPLLYQVATAGIEPSSISFPLRKALQHYPDTHVRWGHVNEVDTSKQLVHTSAGDYSYDKLVIALGADTNFFGNNELETNCFSMKSVPEALLLRNELLRNYEQATITSNLQERQALLNLVVVGGGATGVELAGAIAEMKNNILQKDYPELDFSQMKVYLIEAGDRLLAGLSPYASQKAKMYLERLGVNIRLSTRVKAYDGIFLNTEKESLHSRCVIWAAGVKANKLKGVSNEHILPSGRIKVDLYSKVIDNVFAIGDIAQMECELYPKGHPQVAPVAMQQADQLVQNFVRELQGKSPRPFKYINRGSMATVGRNLAIVELSKYKFGGFFAWLVWMFVHLMSIVGVKNRLWVFFSWLWNYITYDVSLRLIIQPATRKKSGKS